MSTRSRDFLIRPCELDRIRPSASSDCAIPLRYGSVALLASRHHREGDAVDLVSIRMITDDLERTVRFYERITGVTAARYTTRVRRAGHARRSRSRSATRRHRRVVRRRAPPDPAQNRSVIIEFLVDDVDGVHEKLDRLRGGLRQRTHHHALGKPRAAVPRPRRQPRQLLHSRHPGRHQEVHGLTTCGRALSDRRLPRRLALPCTAFRAGCAGP